MTYDYSTLHTSCSVSRGPARLKNEPQRKRYMNGSFEKCQNARNCLKGRALRWVHLMFTRLALSVACRFVSAHCI